MKRIFTLLLTTIGLVSILPAQSTSLKVGDVAPTVNGTDQFESEILSTDITSDKYLTLVFYRGNWCGHCIKHLSELENSFEELQQSGIEVVLVTPENSNGVDKTLEATNSSYSIIADTTYEILDAYESKYKISAETVPKFLGPVTKRTRAANGNEEDILTVPATFVLNQEHKIIWMHYDHDYTQRSKVKDILRAVEEDMSTNETD